MALLTLVDNAYTPIAIFNVLFVQFRLDSASFKRYTSFLDLPEEDRLLAGTELPDFRGEITILQAAFSYNGNPVLRQVSLSIAPGEKVALAGNSGSGKSTLIKLIAGLLKAEDGAILLDGHNLNGLNLDSYYRHITYIPQESPVFDGTLRENLLFDASVPDDGAVRVLQKVQLQEWFDALPDGLDTQLGEKGIKLSGGERQRLALARLWFSSSRLIILDEATSNVDTRTEMKIQKAMRKLMEGKTCFIIAHRLSTIRNADIILVVNDGDVVQQGTHEELIRQDGLYRQMYLAQFE